MKNDIPIREVTMADYKKAAELLRIWIEEDNDEMVHSEEPTPRFNIPFVQESEMVELRDKLMRARCILEAILLQDRTRGYPTGSEWSAMVNNLKRDMGKL
jgi:hypothetical protein